MELKLTAGTAAIVMVAILLPASLADSRSNDEARRAEQTYRFEISGHETRGQFGYDKPNGQMLVLRGDDTAGRVIRLRVDVQRGELLTQLPDRGQSLHRIRALHAVQADTCSSRKVSA